MAAATKTLNTEQIRNTVAHSGTAIANTGGFFTVHGRYDLDAILQVVVQGAVDSDFDDIWTLDTFTVPAAVIGTDKVFRSNYETNMTWLRVTVTARTSPTGGDIDIWIDE